MSVAPVLGQPVHAYWGHLGSEGGGVSYCATDAERSKNLCLAVGNIALERNFHQPRQLFPFLIFSEQLAELACRAAPRRLELHELRQGLDEAVVIRQLVAI